MKNSKIILNNLDFYLYQCFENIYLQYEEGICLDSMKFIEKTEYRIKSYFNELKQKIEKSNDLKEIFEEIKTKALFFEEKKKEIFEKDIEFFYKMKYMFFYNIIVSHYIFLLKEINNKELNNVVFDFEKAEKIFIKEFRNACFVYNEIGTEMYPEIICKKNPVTKFIKKKKKKKKILNEKVLLVIFYILVFCIFFYVVFFLIRFYFLLSDFFFFVFPHKKLSEIDFYEKYNKNLQEINFEEKCELYLTDLYNFCFTDFYSVKTNVLCFLVSIFLLNKYVNFEMFFKKKSIITYRDVCLRSNLLEYHRIMYSFLFSYNINKTFTKEQLIQMTIKRKTNLCNLYYILNSTPKTELVNILTNYKKYIEYNMHKNEKTFLKFIYKQELQHCNVISEILTTKKDSKKIPYDIENFLKKLTIEIELKNKEYQFKNKKRIGIV